MLKVLNCSKSLKKIKAVQHFSMEFGQGVYGLLGPNGAGKTTLMRCICGVYPLDGGSIQKSAGQVGYLPQQFGMFKELTVFEMMEYFSILKQIDKKTQRQEIESCIEEVNLSDRIHSKISSLSGGMIRRMGIAQAILGNPQLILFDEPTAGLDPEERSRFKNTVSKIKGEKTILLSTHIVSDIEATCDTVVIMDHGKAVKTGTPAEIAQSAEGKVYLVQAQQEQQLRGTYFLKDRFEQDGRAFLRVLSGTEQPGEPVSPTMEDGYLCAIKNL